ncbi:DUF4007 family protein [Citrobacter sp. Cb014]|uniref:DUF4007 family protein n=1 Tax=Citrobacter sp. Cb014 TaxID=2985014 RepID=UPI00257B3663|nr:DUF4007 family protein [Citrobacter sp. Cb014]MDM3391793.1 DUF4007 family protein [Citrobacter sp. Cb014]
MSIETSTLKFSGHQTFPIRYGWIYKIIQEVNDGKSISSQDNVEEQMLSMGMGKNMVLSVRYWIRNLNLVSCSDTKMQIYVLTPLAKALFVGKDAYDRYMDKIGTVWLLHWLGQSIDAQYAELNSSRWFFNYFNGLRTSKEQLIKDITLSLSNHGKGLNEATLSKDIDCLFQMYGVKRSTLNKINEDSFTSPFTELGLITFESGKDYRAELSTQSSLPSEVFAYAMIDFIQRKQKDSNGLVINSHATISFDALLNDIGSPGRVFRLSASDLSDKLDKLEIMSKGKFAWTDTQGLRQVQHTFTDIQSVDPGLYLQHYYQGE